MSADVPRFLALGDSYTIGEGVAQAACWPMQLAQRLRDAGSAIGDPRIVAETGWTTDELGIAMDAAALVPPHALVTLLIGVNNQYRGRAVDSYRDDVETLLTRAIALADGQREHVLVVSIPDWGVTRFAREQGRDAAAVATSIDTYNATAWDVAREYGVAFIDITSASRAAGDADAMLVADGLHPSAAQYAVWTALIVPHASAALGAGARIA